MSITITSWLRAFFALQEHASDLRGVGELRVSDDEVFRWPRTLGADVEAIAALFDPHVRVQPLRFGGNGLARRWRACVDALARCPLDAEFSANRMFWPSVGALCVYLHAQRAPLPPRAVWDALFVRIADRPHKELHARTNT